MGLAKVVSTLRPDVTYPGDPGGEVRKRLRPPCPVEDPATEDLVWIPLVAQRGWSIVTRDRRIESYPAERDAVFAYGAKVFAIASQERLDLWHQLEILMTLWRDIEGLSEQPGPFIDALYRTTTRKLL
ncbi:MAG: hypothetical protein ACRDVL_00800 [Acidimicrobiia bacterium]